MYQVSEHGESGFDLAALQAYVSRNKHARIQSGRYFVAVSLAEAESLRAQIHESSGIHVSCLCTYI